MELVHILKSLWSKRVLVAVATAIALGAAIAVAMRGETSQGGTASAEILIDARESALGDLRRETLPLVARSAIFARFLGADGVTEGIAKEAGISKNELAVVGPQLRIDGVPDQASAERALKLTEDAPYLIQVQQGDDLPLLTIYTTAPTEEAAGALAKSTSSALEGYVSKYQEEAAIPDRRRVTIRQLGPVRAGEYKDAPSPILPFGVFIALFGFACFAILAWPSVKTAWRAPERWEPALGSNGGEPSSSRRRPAAALGQSLQRTLASIRPAGSLPAGSPASDSDPEGEGEGEGDAEAAVATEPERPTRRASGAKRTRGT